MAHPREFEVLSDKLLAATASSAVSMTHEEMAIFRQQDFKAYHGFRAALYTLPPDRPLTYDEARQMAIALRDGFLMAARGLEKVFQLGKQ